MPNTISRRAGLVSIGDNVVDHYLDQNVYYPGGNALNVAVLARRFGLGDVTYIGLIGDDEEGAHVHSSLLAEGLSDDHLRQAVGETGKAKVNIVEGDRVFISSNKGGVRKRLMLRMDVDDIDLITRRGHVHSSCFSYLEPELSRIRAVSKELSFDFSTGRDREYLAAICPLTTLAFFSGSDLSDAETDAFIKDIHSLGAGSVCVTQGERGAIFSDGEQVTRQGIVPAKLIDTMGAGDAFIGGFLAARINDAGLDASLAHAAASAAKACEWAGAFGYPRSA
ncbi:PfkB family carbohydrate kinase [Rhizobium rhizogenes]|uniref:PfkB family carbohydrate kinase n=1 Tax=Rhizobium rhizogenes TaxID=359 RepID=UPI001571C965|nr:PfkB family carbohydrate kinase [Rhizobium rhizogenes]NTF72677.1 fructoselysine 6-kinase [Rhizobium rhizogenes]